MKLALVALVAHFLLARRTVGLLLIRLVSQGRSLFCSWLLIEFTIAMTGTIVTFGAFFTVGSGASELSRYISPAHIIRHGSSRLSSRHLD